MAVMFDDLTIMVPAAGGGERLGLGPKAWLELGGRPLLDWVARKALRLSDDVIIAVPQGDMTRAAGHCPACRLMEGSETRQATIERMLSAAQRDWVMIVDVARPFSSMALLSAVLEKAREVGVAGAFIQPDVPVARVAGERVVQDFNRDEVGIFQSPQAFSRTLLADVYDLATASGWQAQSTLQLVLRAGSEVAVVAGEKHNIKITTPEDWYFAQGLLEFLE
jgi:2-C-methyl-D-erythritol 4-phosphate cytidylyltransferase